MYELSNHPLDWGHLVKFLSFTTHQTGGLTANTPNLMILLIIKWLQVYFMHWMRCRMNILLVWGDWELIQYERYIIGNFQMFQ